MKSVAITCVLMLFAATAMAGDLAVSKSTLGDMGLAGMQQLSDQDGMAVRGKGVSAAVWGGSEANWAQVAFDAHGKPHFGPISTSNNNYEAAASWLGPVGADAAGGSLSFMEGMDGIPIALLKVIGSAQACFEVSAIAHEPTRYPGA